MDVVHERDPGVDPGTFGSVPLPVRLNGRADHADGPTAQGADEGHKARLASSPHARSRSLGLERVKALVDEAVVEGFTEVYLTGGEPFLEPDIVEMVLYATERLDVVLLTNGMLCQGWRREQLTRQAGRERPVLQTSIDAASPAGHDRNRGAGSW